MRKFNSKAVSFLAAGAVFTMASVPAFAAGGNHVTTVQSAPMAYGYRGEEAKANQPRCENVEQHYAQYPKASSVDRNGKTLVPGDSALGSERAWQLDLAIASSPICK